jgi:GPH family glycoside/pentoside/hexuronide:cation symporter
LGVSNTLTFHAYSFFWRLPQNFGQWVVVAGCIGTPLGVLLNTAVSPRFEKRDTVIACILFSAAAQATLPLLKIFGVAPIGTALYALQLGVAVAVGAVITIETIAFYSMIADAADEHEHRFGARREGLYFAGLSFAIKASSGAGSFIAGAILDLIRFPAGAAAHGGAIAPGVLLNLGLVFGPGVACATALSVVPILAYGLRRSRHAAILQALARRREGSAGSLGTAA